MKQKKGYWLDEEVADEANLEDIEELVA